MKSAFAVSVPCHYYKEGSFNSISSGKQTCDYTKEGKEGSIVTLKIYEGKYSASSNKQPQLRFTEREPLALQNIGQNTIS